MKLLPIIIEYYQGESSHGFWAGIAGGLLLIASFLLWKWSAPMSLRKGLSVPMLMFGLMVSIGGVADGFHTSRITPGKIILYQKDATAFLKQEKVKVEKTHRGWRGVRIFWALLGLGGILVSILFRKPFWIGAGLGTLVLAVIISLFELYSMNFNEHYYHAIQSASAKKLSFNTKEINAGGERKIRVLKNVKPKPDTYLSQTLPSEILKSSSYTSIHAVAVRDTLNVNTPEALPPPALISEASYIFPTNKTRQISDYSNAGLIQANTKHCWLSKK